MNFKDHIFNTTMILQFSLTGSISLRDNEGEVSLAFESHLQNMLKF